LKTRLIIGLALAIACYSLFAFKQVAETPEKIIANRLILQSDSFVRSVKTLRTAILSGKANKQKLQSLFLQSRLAYKKMEWATEYFTPTLAREINGPPVQEVELGPRIIDPQGLQVIEGLLFPVYNTSNKKELLAQIKLLQTSCTDLQTYFKRVELYNWQIFDAAKLQMYRVITMGITGFDNALTLHSMQESATSLISLKPVIALYNNGQANEVSVRLDAVISYLQAHQTFNTFNRAIFITQYINPLMRDFTRWQKALKLPVIKYNRMLNQDAEILFDKDTFKPEAYGPGFAPATAKQVALGKKLFFDPGLSGTGMRSCGSCHQPEKAFTDGLAKNTVMNGTTLLSRNTPTLINAALQPAQFYDMRAGSLEDQVVDVVQNKLEMHGLLTESVVKLWKDPTYRKQFTEAFPIKERTGVDTLEVTQSIAAYIRSLTLLNSRFDDYMQGDEKALNTSELNGFNLFMGKAKCGTCHYMPLFNGTLPPKYLFMDAEVIGVPATAKGKLIDPDKGRYNLVPIASMLHGFKTPSVRNIARTAPYMHNGVFSTLEEVVDFYDKGGGAGRGIKIKNQTLSSDPLKLTVKEQGDLIAFMRSLDSR